MTYANYKVELQKKYDELFESVGLFWAFSNEQFSEGKAKHPVTEGFKYVSIGAGGYFPGQNKKAWNDGMAAIKAWEKQSKAEMKKAKEPVENVQFVGVDSWNRAVFKSLEKPRRFFGDVNNLFSDDATESEVLAKITEDDLCYFGDHYGCEPMGTDSGNIKIVKA
jgi:hypothetical protein